LFCKFSSPAPNLSLSRYF